MVGSMHGTHSPCDERWLSGLEKSDETESNYKTEERDVEEFDGGCLVLHVHNVAGRMD